MSFSLNINSNNCNVNTNNNNNNAVPTTDVAPTDALRKIPKELFLEKILPELDPASLGASFRSCRGMRSLQKPFFEKLPATSAVQEKIDQYLNAKIRQALRSPDS